MAARYNVHNAVSMILDDDFRLSDGEDSDYEGKRSVATVLFLYSISLECSTVMWLLTYWNSTLFPSGLPAESHPMTSDLQ